MNWRLHLVSSLPTELLPSKTKESIPDQNVGMKPPQVPLAFWENKIPHWGVCLRPDGCTPKISHTGGSGCSRRRGLAPREDGGESVARGGEGCERGVRRVNADSLTKATTAAEGREEHGKRAKVKGTSGGFKFKATVSVCILTAAPHPPTTYTSIYNNNNCAPTSLFTARH